MRADELLEGGDFLRFGPVGAVEDYVGAVREAVGAQHVARRVVTESRQRIITLAPILGEEAGAKRSR